MRETIALPFTLFPFAAGAAPRGPGIDNVPVFVEIDGRTGSAHCSGCWRLRMALEEQQQQQGMLDAFEANCTCAACVVV
jgi:hypothetical protein